jgi:hypothetical protein
MCSELPFHNSSNISLGLTFPVTNRGDNYCYTSTCTDSDNAPLSREGQSTTDGLYEGVSDSIFQDIRDKRKSNPFQLQIAYLNINSILNKCDMLSELLYDNVVDILFVAETKLNASFPNAQFAVDNYRLWRKDMTSHGGGVMVYLRSDIPGDRRVDLEFEVVECISLEIIVNSRRWLISGSYRPPSTEESLSCERT